ncbi:MAG: winged helix-turn-helix transcriptional regulator [Chloroflexi bacterium]|nr:winged helix-turn-helix transcriptional regulator [Chloroflexota bacterium]
MRARKVWNGEHELRLTRLEYAVLEYLARRAGHIVTYQELWHEVWRHTSPLGEGEQRTVRQTIKRIRKKLGEDCGAPRFLYCVYNVGFRCAEDQVTLVE